MSLDGRYVDPKGREFSLAQMDADERRLLKSLKATRRSRTSMARVRQHLAETRRRVLSRSKVRHTDLYRIAQDLGSRLAVAQGIARIPDYRDEIEQLIRARFKTRREFCEATGLSEDMLSHVLARRKHIALDRLNEALARIGYILRIVPQDSFERARRGRRAAA